MYFLQVLFLLGIRLLILLPIHIRLISFSTQELLRSKGDGEGKGEGGEKSNASVHISPKTQPCLDLFNMSAARPNTVASYPPYNTFTIH